MRSRMLLAHRWHLHEYHASILGLLVGRPHLDCHKGTFGREGFDQCLRLGYLFAQHWQPVLDLANVKPARRCLLSRRALAGLPDLLCGCCYHGLSSRSDLLCCADVSVQGYFSFPSTIPVDITCFVSEWICVSVTWPIRSPAGLTGLRSKSARRTS